MKVLIVHNRYQQEGGEDHVFDAEAVLLEAHGHQVVRYVDDNDRIPDVPAGLVAAGAFWNPRAHRELRRSIRRERPHVVHLHNTFPLISPAAYYAARAEGVPTIQTLHNYRLMCTMGMFYRDGNVCQDCLERPIAWPGVLHACYRNSRLASAVVAGVMATHRAVGTWRSKVDRYIALTEFARDQFVTAGLPPERIRVKSNFIDPDPGMGDGRGDYALFVGRLVPEKGIETLLAAWRRMEAPVGLRVVGDGPLAPMVAEAAANDPRIRYLGWVPHSEAVELMGDALAVVVPSVCYESFPLVLVEAFARGTPVVASAVGALAEIVEHERSGLGFATADPGALADAVARIASRPAEREAMRTTARATYETRYTARASYERLMEIYAEARRARGLAPVGEPALAGAGTP